MIKIFKSPIFIFASIGLLTGFFLAVIVSFDIISSWQKLPSLPAEPIKIINVELGNVLVKTENDTTYRCYIYNDECWTEDLKLTVPSWWNDDYGWGNDFRSFENCDYSKPYFLTWRFSTKKIIDCVYEVEVFVDWGVTTVVLIDQHGHVWTHSNSWSAIGSYGAIRIYPIFCMASGLILGICVVMVRKILKRRRKITTP